ncbi:MAG TPA: MBL fold metallo-hydrolase [Anaerovoracaceae bacterium]|nr:MBL fold metallo-hydrolase [Anaerovoracaceae bacterium]
MQLTIYRGTKEVGGTMIEIKSKKNRILLDAGYPLFLNGEVIDEALVKRPYQELLELGVIPKVKGLYRWDTPTFDGVLISHAHSDHFGLLKFIHPDIPIYLTETTDKLIEMNLTFPIPDYSHRKRITVQMYEPFCVGDIWIKPYRMDHSAFQAAAFEIKCEGKRILYTGDFRGHGRRGEYLERFLKEAEMDPDLLLIEGTTLGRTGEAERTEEELEAEFKQVIVNQQGTEESGGIVLCQPTSQNIDRVISFYKAAKACGKIFVMDIYTANLLYELKKLGNNDLPVPSLWRPDIRVFYPMLLTKKMEKLLGKKYSKRFRAYGISGKGIHRKQKEIVMLVRPSMLADLKLMRLKNGTLIFSQWQVYRDKPYQLRLEEYLKSRGFTDCYLHTSGHAFEEDINKVIKGLSPKEIVPIHSFCPEEFAKLHKNVTLRQDGIPFEL